MKNYVKKICGILAVLMLLSALAIVFSSCKDENPDGAESKSDVVETTKDTSGGDQTDSDVDYMTQIPEGKFDFLEIKFLTKQGNYPYMFETTDGGIDGSVSKEVAAMEAFIETTYEVELTYEWTFSHNDEFNPVFYEALSGGRELDIVCPDFYYGLETSGGVKNMLDYSDIIKFENPYWISGWNDQATINGKLYNPSSYIGLDVAKLPEVIFFNQYMAEDLKITQDLFQLVRDEKWTLEEMKKMMLLGVQDKGDAGMTFDDNYGLVYNLWSGRALLNGAGFALGKNIEGDISFDLVDTKNIDIFQEVYKFVHYDNDSYYSPQPVTGNREKDGRFIFIDNRALFMADSVSMSSTVSQHLDSFGVIPLPMYDLDQGGYVTPLMGCIWNSIMYNSENDIASATILEAMAIYSYEKVYPVYYEDTLKLRYQSDPESAEMIDLIRDSIHIDLAFIFTKQFDLIADTPFNLIAAEDRNYSSSMKKHIDTIDIQLADLKEFYGLSE